MEFNPTTVTTQSQRIGLSDREAKRFSFLRAIQALAAPDNPRAQAAAAFEFEVSEATRRLTGRPPRGFAVPYDVLSVGRAMTVGTPSAGGYLKGTDLHPESFIDRLHNSMCIQQAGAQLMPGLVGDIAIPKLSAGSTAYWVAEDSALTASTPTLGQMALAPKQVGAYVELSRKLVAQSTPAAEIMVQNDLALTIALAIDRAALHGAGGDEPTGIIGTAGIGTVAGGTNGAAPTLAHMVALESTVASANGDIGRLAYITNSKVRAKLRQVFTNQTYGSEPVWTQDPNGAAILGTRAFCSNQVRSDLTKNASGAVCSAVFFGNWSDLVIATWTGLDLLLDPYTLSTTGQLRVVAMQLVNIGVRRPESFAVMADVLTT